MLTSAWLVVMTIGLAAVHAVDAKVDGRTVWFPSLRLFRRHSDDALSAYMLEMADRPFNHEHVGITALQPPMCSPDEQTAVPRGMRVNARRQLLGRGREVYEKAVREGLRERGLVNRLSWAEFLTAESDSRRWRKGMTLLTVAKCYGVLWAANPCRLVFADWDRKLPPSMGRGRYSSVGFSTVIGHLVAGEERFSVEWREDDSSVWLDLYSVSTGKGVLGKVAMPFIRPIQKEFFAAQCRHMVALMSACGDT